jgi:hypothetical protein
LTCRKTSLAYRYLSTKRGDESPHSKNTTLPILPETHHCCNNVNTQKNEGAWQIMHPKTAIPPLRLTEISVGG